ncbi:hypothetical protein DSC45_23730 [Streptomyces sp. YIM 130001]|uniref:hypothetical protein n=1 Tax=Streptomyces sp. YIM 130001 TaxID=2259644 RepID=UPI000EEA824F|nr:hypothetical protein [Streptomyces sp. YIM 130001]RII13364.1 hypothetical protein DSC45_23730 [Streptomyces sp. YIM 130001]
MWHNTSHEPGSAGSNAALIAPRGVATSAGKFTPVHDAWWAQARKVHGERDCTRALIEFLLLNRHLAVEHVVAGLVTALQASALTADAVALEARKGAQSEDEPTDGTPIPPVSGQARQLSHPCRSGGWHTFRRTRDLCRRRLL